MEITLNTKSKLPFIEKINCLLIDNGFWFLMFLFFCAAEVHIMNVDAFANFLHRMPLLESVGVVLAYLITVLEMSIVILLLLPSTRELGLFISLILLIIFTTYLIYIISIAAHLPCPCEGIMGGLTWTQCLGLNLLLVALNIACLPGLKITISRSSNVVVL
ncbi:MauE/DoxX family redox-associated membrane protein [Pedobacter sp. AW31-3R]|uniref:MauE/DoxX family redox-associated membrane protein n=1 Tax=Pedobacter sp. AW31-3R TaxID=3445781 RepID=UPI003F9F3013